MPRSVSLLPNQDTADGSARLPVARGSVIHAEMIKTGLRAV